MPIIRVEMFEGRTVEQKRALAAALTDAIVEHAGANRDSVRVIIDDYAKTNWAIAGELVSDREAKGSVADSFGALEGEIEIADDFDDLPPGFEEYV